MKHLLGVALLFCAVIANAQTLLWKPLLGPQVGFNKVIAFNGDTTLCNLFSSPMLVMTTDRGKTWIQHGNTLFDTEQQHFWYQNGIITVFAGETLFRSKDWGASWSSSGMPLAVHKSYLNGDTLIITQRVDSFVAVSTSGGNSWETKKLSRRVLFIHMGMLFSRDSTGLHRSSDMGETWQRIRTYTPGNPERFTYTSSTNGIVEVENRDSLLATNLEFYDGIISVSSDGGTKWGEVHRSEPNTLSFIVRIQESIFLYSHEYNKSNIRISIIDISGSPALKELGVYPSSSYMIRNINATDVVISNSSNSTKNTLYPQSGKPVPLNQTSLNTEIGSALYLRDMNIFYAQNSELIHHSTNGGTTWTTINTNAKLQSSPFNIACNLAVPDDSTIALTASPQRGLTSQPTLTVVTSNGGKKWTTYSDNQVTSYYPNLCEAEGYVYFGSTAIYRNFPIDFTSFQTLPLAPTNVARYVAHRGSVFVRTDSMDKNSGLIQSLWRSDDGGYTWTKLNLPDNIIWFTFCDASRALVLLDYLNKCYRSFDKGTTWERTNNTFNAVGTYALEAFHSFVVALTPSSDKNEVQVMFSTDYGETWKPSTRIPVASSRQGPYPLRINETGVYCGTARGIYHTPLPLGAVSVESEDEPGSVAVIPNPTTETIEVNVQNNSSVVILSALGEQLCEVRNYEGQRIDVSAFPSGTYYVRCSTTKGIVVQPFVIVR